MSAPGMPTEPAMTRPLALPTAGPRALEQAKTPRPFLILAVLMTLAAAGAAVAAGVLPWQQTAIGGGVVVAFNPIDRPQRVDAPISGRVERWMVVEGMQVKRDDAIAEIRDIDPLFVERLEDTRAAVAARIVAAEARVEAYERKREASETGGELAVEAARLEVRMAGQKLASSQQKLTAARAGLKAARQQVARVRKLAAEGLAAQREVELAELADAKADADVRSAEADVTEAQAYRTAREAKELQTEADAGAKVAEAKAEVQKAASEVAYARGEFAKIETDLARQQARVIRAPRDGTVLELAGHAGGMVVKQGERLAVIVPDGGEIAVELWVDGNDAPLVRAGRRVRLQFEGWPALQMAGWPSVAVGTFGGVVAFVDTASRRDGAFRVVVRPDPAEEPWPDSALLRQGLRAKGWVLLETVSLGYELWRQFNGFPRELPGSPAARVEGGGKGTSKGHDAKEPAADQGAKP